jgi:hypothetical protein
MAAVEEVGGWVRSSDGKAIDGATSVCASRASIMPRRVHGGTYQREAERLPAARNIFCGLEVVLESEALRCCLSAGVWIRLGVA